LIKIINRTGKFMSQLNENEKAGLELAGEFLVGKMNIYTPVRTGYLRSRNSYQISKNELYLQNDAPYAGFVEYGTYKMKAQPFMKPAATLYTSDLMEIFEMCFGKGME